MISRETIVALLGSGAIAIWHDIASAARAAFYAWHGEEHMPERAGVPGFLRGRRYVAAHGPSRPHAQPEFFNLYETATVGVLTGRDYLARLDHPTPQTLATVAHFRNVARALCKVEASHGRSDGGLVATFRYEVDAESVDAHRGAMLPALAALASEPGVAGVHWLATDRGASGVDTAERKARASSTAVPGWIVLLEWWGDHEPLFARGAAFVGGGSFATASTTPSWGVYRVQNACAAPLHGAASHDAN